MNLTVVYIILGFMILFAIVQFFNLLDKASKNGKNELLDEMLENKDIDAEIYVKYKK